MRFHLRPELLFSRGEPEDARLGDVVQLVTPVEFAKNDWDVALLGLPDDRGVTLNRGRPGAAEGPSAIRKWLYRLVSTSNSIRIADIGDLAMTDDLNHDHEVATQAIAFALANARRVVILGGGHDWGYCPISALAKMGRTGFINIDAHLDVRPSDVHHSGTSYWRALETHVSGEDAMWYGVQPSGTATLHRDYVTAKGGRIWQVDAANAPTSEIVDAMSRVAGRCEGIDLSLDLDVFAMAYAPGVSAPQPSGLEPNHVIDVIKGLLALSVVRTIGVYELSPPHDISEATARLAARCVWEVCR